MWTSRLLFLLAAIGFTVGPGNIWRFPYLAGQHGGGAFVLLYLLAVAAVAVPILIAELMVGRRGRGAARWRSGRWPKPKAGADAGRWWAGWGSPRPSWS